MIPTIVGIVVALGLAVVFGWLGWRSRRARNGFLRWPGIMGFALLTWFNQSPSARARM